MHGLSFGNRPHTVLGSPSPCLAWACRPTRHSMGQSVQSAQDIRELGKRIVVITYKQTYVKRYRYSLIGKKMIWLFIWKLYCGDQPTCNRHPKMTVAVSSWIFGRVTSNQSVGDSKCGTILSVTNWSEKVAVQVSEDWVLPMYRPAICRIGCHTDVTGTVNHVHVVSWNQ